MNAKDYGATGDGVTDDVPALNRALAEAIQVRNTDGVTIRGNHLAPSASGDRKVNPIVVETCRHVQVSP